MIKLFAVAFLFISNSSFALENNKSSWLGTFANIKLTEKFNYWIETQVRYNLDLGNTAQVLYRTGVLQKMSETQGLGYLYAFIQSGNAKEHRLTLQHTQNYGNFSEVKLSHRARLESRFLEDDVQSYDTGARVRYLLRAEKLHSHHYAFVIWDEVFINLNKTSWNGNDHLDRNRFFIGVKKGFLNSNHFEIGYLNQFVPRDSGDISEHIATFYFFF